MTSTPEYPESVIAAVNAQASTGRRGRERGYSFTISAHRELAPLIKRAAAMRGCTTTTYVRRALAAFLAHDLGMRLTDVTRTFPAAVQSGMRNTPGLAKGQRSEDDGEGYGSWRIELL